MDLQTQTPSYWRLWDSPDLMWSFALLSLLYWLLSPSLLPALLAWYRTALNQDRPAPACFPSRPSTVREVEPPCESVIKQAEANNHHNGHENLGFLSRQAGFMPLHSPVEAFPSSHDAWDRVAQALPALIQSQSLRVTVDQMPILKADEQSLPDIYVHRAATVLAIVAHAYVRLDGETSLTASIPHKDMIPPSLEIPWSQICKRLGRHATFMTYIDLVIYNYKSQATRWQDIKLDTVGLLVPTVDNQEERTFYGTMVEISAQCTPIIANIIQAQRGVLSNEPATVKEALNSLLETLTYIMHTSLSRISASSKHPSHMDSVIWAKSVANLAVPWVKGVPGAAGTSHPFFHMMDEFIERKTYKEKLGIEAQCVRSDYPLHWKQFIAAISEVSVADFVKGARDKQLTEKWNSVLKIYGGSEGILGFHKRKVFGYLSMSFRVGRNSTINGFKGKPVEKPWMDVHIELEKARNERDHRDEPAMPLDSTTQTTASMRKLTDRIPVHELLQHTNDAQGYWFVAEGRVYDATKFMKIHPGGERIISLCSGRDATSDLAALAHLSDRKIRAMLVHNLVGILDVRRFISPFLQDLYDRTVAFAYKLAELETTYANHMTFLDGKLTRLDRPGVMTAQKAHFLRISNEQIKDHYTQIIATYMDGILDVINEVLHDNDADFLEELIRQLRNISTPRIDSGYFDSHCMDSARWIVSQNLAHLRECKEHITTVLCELHKVGEDSQSLCQGSVDSVITNLELIGRRALQLGTSPAGKPQKCD